MKKENIAQKFSTAAYAGASNVEYCLCSNNILLYNCSPRTALFSVSGFATLVLVREEKNKNRNKNKTIAGILGGTGVK